MEIPCVNQHSEMNCINACIYSIVHMLQLFKFYKSFQLPLSGMWESVGNPFEKEMNLNIRTSLSFP